MELAADRGAARRFQAGGASEVRQGRAAHATEAAMRLLQRGRRGPRAKTIAPAEPYLLAGADEARRLGHDYVGTEHVLGCSSERGVAARCGSAAGSVSAPRQSKLHFPAGLSTRRR